ncbi:2,3-bisphosphoglycerate-independent phosphoglycerate mutase [Rubinisphaera margarita]|uniref:2,3-bisphosphoglycerate-independent phosphoglycerate mutase n=1 Tax=Rubinisphaera margarita TaxID=2909586 RepID=UPI001EE8FE17|nr:2,3-bisphosphoglycerate-independent phosphoglycerate mutase [Rubinisphaera margarita]MCG6157077.1 2,3-bisphosphoglycerate-independent phosphoglycerate mutase [Rubinisphaera margarita]
MNLHDLTRELQRKNDSKIVMLVADGLGGLPQQPGGQTELESAKTPNLDALAKKGTLGLSTPVLPGVTPGSGPGHLGLFGYDPIEYNIGRGVLEALGIDFELGPKDVAIRGNYCSLDENGNISDRRAGRIGSDVGAKLCEKLDKIEIPGVEVFVRHVKEYRLVIVFRGEGLGGDVADTDPQRTGVAPLEPTAKAAGSEKTVEIAKEFLKQAREVLKDDFPANFLTLRGIAKKPEIPTYEEVYGTRSAAIAVYPMYRGLARLVGMDVLDAGQTLDDQCNRLEAAWNDYDFFFMHFKYTDSTGEDGNFAKKVERIEELDAAVPRITALNPDVLIVTGDHSTPSMMKSHSWHPVPTMISADTCRFDACDTFGESSCLKGGLGQFEAKYLMSLALAHAGRLEKYGA